eukprot:PhM_4_TR4162/c0_g1_i1/m.61503
MGGDQSRPLQNQDIRRLAALLEGTGGSGGGGGVAHITINLAGPPGVDPAGDAAGPLRADAVDNLSNNNNEVNDAEAVLLSEEDQQQQEQQLVLDDDDVDDDDEEHDENTTRRRRVALNGGGATTTIIPTTADTHVIIKNNKKRALGQVILSSSSATTTGENAAGDFAKEDDDDAAAQPPSTHSNDCNVDPVLAWGLRASVSQAPLSDLVALLKAEIARFFSSLENSKEKREEEGNNNLGTLDVLLTIVNEQTETEKELEERFRFALDLSALRVIEALVATTSSNNSILPSALPLCIKYLEAEKKHNNNNNTSPACTPNAVVVAASQVSNSTSSPSLLFNLSDGDEEQQNNNNNGDDNLLPPESVLNSKRISFDMTSGTRVRGTHRSIVRCFCLSPCGEYVALGHADGVVEVVSLTSAASIATLNGRSGDDLAELANGQRTPVVAGVQFVADEENKDKLTLLVLRHLVPSEQRNNNNNNVENMVSSKSFSTSLARATWYRISSPSSTADEETIKDVRNISPNVMAVPTMPGGSSSINNNNNNNNNVEDDNDDPQLL